MTNLFQSREHVKPYEYPICLKFVESIQQSFWTHKEFNFTIDIQEYHTELNDYEREIVKKCLLLISQIEVGVKTFWSNIHHQLPKPEVLMVGATFGESEVRHLLAYSHLLEIMGLNEEFEKIYDIPVIIGRHNYLKKYKDYLTARSEPNFLKSIILFSILIESVSLFSQFFILQSFNKFKKRLRDINNVVAATSKEEAIHGEFGLWLINKIKEEHPDFWSKELQGSIIKFCEKALMEEGKVLSWIFDQGDISFIKMREVNAFINDRMNKSLKKIGISHEFHVDKGVLENTLWFDEELLSDCHVDFFDQRPSSYSRKNKPITANDLF